MKDLFHIPEPASAIAGQVDSVFLFILAVVLFFFIVTQGALIYFAVKYRKRKDTEEEPETPQIRSNVVLEGIWIAVPTLLIFAIFAYGYLVFARMQQPVPGAKEINVVAKKWLWEFDYQDGRKAVNELRLAKGEPVELVMTSEDVIHSLFLPEFRVKQDILPGRYTHMWLTPEKTGEYQIFCAEYCGEGHSTMLAKLIVMEPAAYHEWKEQQAAGGAAPSSEQGKKIVEDSGCLSCHSIDGSAKVGPTFRGLFGRTVTLEDGSTVTAEEDYIHESIVQPGAKIVKGFKNVMPTFKGTLSPPDITSVISYLKTLGRGAGAEHEEEEAHERGEKTARPPSAENGRKLVDEYGCLACHTTDGSKKTGPSFKAIYGKTETMDDGTTAKVDKAYIAESMMEPSLKIVKGYMNLMPSFKGKISDAEAADISEYIKTLAGPEGEKQ